jgi:hypothetical protein
MLSRPSTATASWRRRRRERRSSATGQAAQPTTISRRWQRWVRRVGGDSELRLAIAEAAVRDAPSSRSPTARRFCAVTRSVPAGRASRRRSSGSSVTLETGAVAVSDGNPLDAQWSRLHVPNLRARLDAGHWAARRYDFIGHGAAPPLDTQEPWSTSSRLLLRTVVRAPTTACRTDCVLTRSR